MKTPVTPKGLPPLPDPTANIKAGHWSSIVDCTYYSAEQMQAYAREALAAQAASVELVGYQYRWTNPSSDKNQSAEAMAWKPVEPRGLGTVENKCVELLAYRFELKPVYEVRATYASAPPSPASCLRLKRIEGLPKGTTHVHLGKPYWELGSFSVTLSAFKYEDGIFKQFGKDSDGEYPGWRPYSGDTSKLQELT